MNKKLKDNDKGEMVKNPQIIFLIIIVAFGLVAGGYLLNPSSSTSSSSASQSAQATVADPAKIHNDQAPIVGSPDAKVKIVIFSDYQCPYCKVAHQTINSLLDKYPNDVNVEIRNFVVHDTAGILAQAAEAANKQGKIKEMSDALFSDTETVDASENGVKDLAKKLGLNSAEFEKALNSDDVKNRISKDEEDALALGLNGTPSIFVNNKSADSASLESIVQSELGQ